MNTSNPKDNYSNEILDDLELNRYNLSEIVSWWESKRLWFNLLVGLSGVIGLSYNSFQPRFDEIAGIIIWGILANILYSTGMTLELLEIHYLKRIGILRRLRKALLIIGMLTTCLVTFLFSLIS